MFGQIFLLSLPLTVCECGKQLNERVSQEPPKVSSIKVCIHSLPQTERLLRANRAQPARPPAPHFPSPRFAHSFTFSLSSSCPCDPSRSRPRMKLDEVREPNWGQGMGEPYRKRGGSFPGSLKFLINILHHVALS